MHYDKLSIFGKKNILENALAYVQEYTGGVSEEESHFDLFIDTDSKNIVESIIQNLSKKYNFKFTWSKVKHKNWQNNWKKYFTTIHINSFFTVVPDWKKEEKINTFHKIIIFPGMAFGTGHHESTFMILDLLPEIIDSGDQVVDVGTGSGILLIAAMKLGASYGLGIENDPICKENFEKNIRINNIKKKNVQYQGISFLNKTDYSCDVLIANLNKNLIFSFFDSIRLFPSKIIISGILYLDLDEVLKKIKKLKLKIKILKKKNEWICLLLEK